MLAGEDGARWIVVASHIGFPPLIRLGVGEVRRDGVESGIADCDIDGPELIFCSLEHSFDVFF